MATHSGTLAWKIPWMKEPGGLQSMGSVAGSWTLLSDFTLTFHFSRIGEGNGNPIQYSCLENLRDGGPWWAAVYGVAQSRTWLKWLSSSSSSPYVKLRLCRHIPTLPFCRASKSNQMLPVFHRLRNQITMIDRILCKVNTKSSKAGLLKR